MITLLKNKLLQFFSQCFRYLCRFFAFFGKHPVIGGVCLFISLLFTFYAFVLDRRGEDSSTVSIKIVEGKIDRMSTDVTAIKHGVEKINAREMAEKLIRENALLKEIKNRRKLSKNQKEVVTQEITRAIDGLVTDQREFGGKGKVTGALEALKNSDTAKVKKLLSGAIKHSKQSDQKTAQMYRNLGAFSYLDDLQDSLQAYRKATELAPDNVDGWMMLGVVLEDLGRLDDSTIALQKVLNLTNSLNKKSQVREVPMRTIDFYQEGLTSEYDKMALYRLFFTDSSPRFHYDKGKNNTYRDLGNISRIQGDFTKATDYYEQSMENDHDLGNKRGLASRYGNLGLLYREKGEIKKSIKFFEKSLSISNAMNLQDMIMSNHINLGVVYQDLNELNKSYKHYKKAFESDFASEKAILRARIKRGLVYANIGTIYMLEDNQEKAQRFWLGSLDHLKKIDKDSPTVQRIQFWLDSLSID